MLEVRLLNWQHFSFPVQKANFFDSPPPFKIMAASKSHSYVWRIRNKLHIANPRHYLVILCVTGLKHQACPHFPSNSHNEGKLDMKDTTILRICFELPMRHNYSAEIPINVDSAVNVVVSGNSRLGASTNGTNKRPIRSICWSFCSVPVNGARFHAFASFQPTASGTKA